MHWRKPDYYWIRTDKVPDNAARKRPNAVSVCELLPVLDDQKDDLAVELGATIFPRAVNRVRFYSISELRYVQAISKLFLTNLKQYLGLFYNQ